MDTLAVQLAVPLAGPALDLHQLVNTPCRAHKVKAVTALRSVTALQKLAEVRVRGVRSGARLLFDNAAYALVALPGDWKRRYFQMAQGASFLVQSSFR